MPVSALPSRPGQSCQSHTSSNFADHAGSVVKNDRMSRSKRKPLVRVSGGELRVLVEDVVDRHDAVRRPRVRVDVRGRGRRRMNLRPGRSGPDPGHAEVNPSEDTRGMNARISNALVTISRDG